jgi:NAD+ synthase
MNRAITQPLSADLLKLDPERETKRIVDAIRALIVKRLRRRGAVIGLSGGVDSSLVAALCVEALGPDRVFGLFMPERECSGDSLRLGRLLAEHLGIRTALHDVTSILSASECYSQRDAAIRSVIPDYAADYKCKLFLSRTFSGEGYPVFYVVVQSPRGDRQKVRLTATAYRELVAATNFKQRVRKMVEYYHADRLQYAVVGTPNRLEYDQGFFVKNGDGAADIKPIAHLYKTQVYQLAEFLGLPQEIQARPSTTDTYSLDQSQEEFYFSLPLRKLDLCLYGANHGCPADEVARLAGLTTEDVEQVYRDIRSKRNATRYLHLSPLLVQDVEEVSLTL